MAVVDLWRGRDGQPTARSGRGKRWRVAVPGQPTRSFTSKVDAVEYERMIASRPDDGGVRVGELVASYVKGKADLSAGGRGAIEAGARHVLSRWEWVDVADVQEHEVQAWLANLQVQRGPRTAELVPASTESKIKALQVMRGAIKIARDTGRLSVDPTKGLRVPRRRMHDPRYLTVAELGRLADATPDPGMVWLLGTTGVRIGESVAADKVDVTRGKKARLRVRRSKSGEGRDVPIPSKTLARLDLEGDGPLFQGVRGGRVNIKHWRERVFQPALAEAGLSPDTHIHDLRHTAARLMVYSGATVKDVQSALGHSSAKMTLDIYAGLFDHTLDDVAKRMNKML